jgi:hypothetical protein
MRKRSRCGLDAWTPLGCGLLWLWLGAHHGRLGFLLALLPGVLLVCSGGARLVWREDRRSLRFVALGALIGAAFGIFALFLFPLAGTVALLAMSGISFVAAGRASLRADPPRRDVPEALLSVGMSARVAVDEAVLAGQDLMGSPPSAADLERIRGEVAAARDLFAARGWLADPGTYHREPPPLESPNLERRRPERGRRQIAYEVLTFESGYEPDAAEPGRGRGLGYSATRTAHAVVLRHAGAPRPWLVCVHGYLMGQARFGFWIFDAIRHYQGLGFNVALPVLPLHGPRRVGRFSGEGFLGGDVLDTIHAEAQTVWDLRRLVGWIRAQGGPRIGVHGVSLGGYTAALFAGIDSELACVIAGIPPVDLARLVWHHAPAPTIRLIESSGIVHDEVAELYRVVSPLAFQPKIPALRRAIYAGIGDRLVPADHPRDLWEHWGRPRIAWMQSGHDPRTGEARSLVEDTLRSALVARHGGG